MPMRRTGPVLALPVDMRGCMRRWAAQCACDTAVSTHSRTRWTACDTCTYRLLLRACLASGFACSMCLSCIRALPLDVFWCAAVGCSIVGGVGLFGAMLMAARHTAQSGFALRETGSMSSVICTFAAWLRQQLQRFTGGLAILLCVPCHVQQLSHGMFSRM
jgi:hypothetical protein